MGKSELSWFFFNVRLAPSRSCPILGGGRGFLLASWHSHTHKETPHFNNGKTAANFSRKREREREREREMIILAAKRETSFPPSLN